MYEREKERERERERALVYKNDCEAKRNYKSSSKGFVRWEKLRVFLNNEFAGFSRIEKRSLRGCSFNSEKRLHDKMC